VHLLFSAGLHSTASEYTGEPPTIKKSSPLNVAIYSTHARYCDLRPTSKTDWPKHCVTHFVRLALVRKEGITIRDENLNEITKLTLQGEVDKMCHLMA